ncbi:phosphate ABC transporter, permease [Deferribacter desulfuricans SSM1]|uniref:Phosphate transport system permease protein PstA n=1 Tax=Deferribacter desulfuricans (strain DSM 14783 / JCM 11476 / NBRC 101012 / SSM1) TaxID=639282 RepID=D3PBC2_DEFDS|nr:phosphate ABC transporter permease PstA [Deferribacter desulfuricans]BAI79895.1 phosphate ABC transporter, permease [Deferribacter desulfuricans SSM1]
MKNNIRRRKIINAFALSVAMFCALLGLFWLVFILFDILKEGISYITPDLFLEDPAPPGIEGGGLRNAFIGQILIIIVATIIGVPLGILGGTYLAEYGKNSRIAKFVSTLADIMISVPAIVVGTFVYAVMVRPLGHFSGWAGGVSLAIIMLPIVVRTTEDMLRLIPDELREAAFALGAPYYKVIMNVVYKGAATGILTGVILAIARVAGEAAPLLFTSFNNSFFTMNLNEPTPSLTVTIFQYAMGPYEDWHQKAWAASFIITFTILIVTIIARLLIKWRYKK